MTTDRIPPRDALLIQLAAIAGNERDGLFEVRFMRPGRGPGQAFHPADRPDSLIETILRLGAATDTYVGACPRRRRRGRAQDVERAWVLWGDYDTDEALAALAAFAPQPSIIIRSGTGERCHAYWPMREPIAAQHLERANRRIAHATGADPASTDVARVLRPAGTFNHKHDPPTPVECIRLELRVFTARDVVGHLSDPPEEVTVSHASSTAFAHSDRNADALCQIPAREYVPLLTGREANRQGYVRCPFHGNGQERTPSLFVNCRDEMRWKCFGCSEPRGSIIDFGARLYAIDPHGAGYHRVRERLAADLLGSLAAA